MYKGPKSRKDFLNDLKFPSTTPGLGPATRSGDFAEILIADYLEWKLGFWAPRVRWASKINRDSSPQGCDVLGLSVEDLNNFSIADRLIVFEVKASLSVGGSKTVLKKAVEHSAKDHLRLDESLNYVRQKMVDAEDAEKVALVNRFQSPVDAPYTEKYGAAAVFVAENYDENKICEVDTGNITGSQSADEAEEHPNKDALSIIVVKGDDMMNLVHELYRRAADEA